MSNLLQLQNGYKSFGAKILFNEASFSINQEEHVGVIGPNGAGKTTLFRVLTGHETLDHGQLVQAKNLRVGYLAQHDSWTTETVEEYLSLAGGKPLWELKSLGRGLGLSEEIFKKPITSLSGGFRMRCKLLFLIGQEPDLMLLDEPTNYLDLESTLVLENFLQGYRGAFLLISHDREFLRRTTDHILEIEGGEITKFNGNLDDYFEQKEMLRTQLSARAASLQEKRQQILDFVARFGAKASKAKQAQSRLKSLQKMESIELKALPVGAAIPIPAPRKTGKVMMSVQDVNCGYDDKIILSKVHFQLLNGDHMAVVGHNGVGKSTLLRTLARRLSPLQGSVSWGPNVEVGYFAQHVSENLDPQSTVIDEMTRTAHPEVTRQEALNLAGSLLFSGDDIHKKISFLSGGEKSRVALGQILLKKSPCLILDEPTNHLDFQTVESLTQALCQYDGTVVVVSHDRSFIKRVGTKILEIDQGQVRLYPGTYDEYVWSLEKGAFGPDPASRPEIKALPSRTPESGRPPTTRELRKSLEKQFRQVEKEMSQVEKSLVDIQETQKQLNEQIAAGTCLNLRESVSLLSELHKRTDELELKWLELCELKDSLKTSLSHGFSEN